MSRWHWPDQRCAGQCSQCLYLQKSGNLDVKNSLPMLASVLVFTVVGSFVASLLPERAMSGTMQIALIIIGLRSC